MGTASFNYVPTRLLARTEQAAVADGKNQSLLSIRHKNFSAGKSSWGR
jgi:hypothetical protein